MPLQFKYLEGCTRGKSRWQLVLVEPGNEPEVLAHSPQEFNVMKHNDAARARIKKLMPVAYLEDEGFVVKSVSRRASC